MVNEFTIHQFRLFASVYELGSISRAAIALSVSQSSVSRATAHLESITGVRLFERTRAGVVATAAGERFYRHAVEAVRHHDLARSLAIDSVRPLVGEVRVATTESVAAVLFRPLVRQFQQDFPQAKIRVTTSASVLIPGMLDNNVVDIGVIADTHVLPPMPAEPLCQENFYLVGPRGVKETNRDTITLKQVAALPLFLNAMQGGFRARIDEAFAQRGLTMQVRAEIDANEPLLDLVLEEEAYTILPFSAVAGTHRNNQVSVSRIVAPTISRKFNLVTSRARPLSAICRETARLVRNVMRDTARYARWKWA